MASDPFNHAALAELHPHIPNLEGAGDKALRDLAADFAKAEDIEGTIYLLLSGLREQAQGLKSLNQDTLTGLINRRGFDLILGHEISKNNRVMFRQGESRLCLIYGDLTGFKSINDNHGHGGGDAALKHVARILEQSTRDTDIVVRFSGDEFGVILPDCGIEQSRQVMARITEHFAQNPFVLDGVQIPLGINMDTAAHEKDETVSDFTARVDRMMLDAKDRYYAEKGLVRRGSAPSEP